MKIDSIWRLELFLAVADTLSFTRAAERLHMTQPGVSRGIKHLEDAVGGQLFDRTPRKLALTEAGEQFAREARTLMKAVEEAEEGISAAAGIAGPLHLGATNMWEYIIPSHIGAFLRAYPQVSVNLRTDTTEGIASLLMECQISLGLTGSDPGYPEIEGIPLVEHEFVLVGPPGHPLSKLSSVAADALKDMTYLRRYSGRYERLQRESYEYLGRYGIKPKRIIDMGGNESIKRAVGSGLGLAILPKIVVADELANGTLSRMRLDAPPHSRMLYVLRNRNRHFSSTQEAFVSFVRIQLERVE